MISDEPREGALAVLEYEPLSEPGAGDLGLAAVRAALSSGVISGSGARKATASLVAVSEAVRGLFRVTLLSCDLAERGIGPGGLQAVIELPGQDLEELRPTLRAVLTGWSETGTQSVVSGEAGGLSYGVFESEDWPDWFAVEWAAAGNGVVIGLGRGSIRAWEVRASEPFAPIGTHRGHLGEQERPGEVFLSLGVDLDAVRRASPVAFSSSPAGRVLTAATLSNARTYSAHWRFADEPGSVPVIGLDVAWSSRRWKPRRVAAASLWPARHPESAAKPGGRAQYAIYVPNQLARDVFLAARVHEASADTPREARRRAFSFRKWATAHAAAVDRIASEGGSWFTLSAEPVLGASLPVPNRVAVVAGQDRDAAQLLEDWVGVGRAFGLEVERLEDGSWAAPLLEGTGVRALRSVFFGLGPDRELVARWGVPISAERASGARPK